MRRGFLTLRLSYVLRFMCHGSELVRDRIGAVMAAMKRVLSYRVALLALVVVMTPGAIILASRLTDPGPPAPAEVDPIVETSDTSPPSVTATPELRGPRQAPSEWQLRTRSSPELAAQYPLADLYTDDEIAYFKEIAFGVDPEVAIVIEGGITEGARSRLDHINKWNDGTVTYYVGGDIAMGDRGRVEAVIAELDTLIPPLNFRPAALSDASLRIFFRTPNEFPTSVTSRGKEILAGLGQLYGNNFVIDNAEVFIRSELPKRRRNHVILHEITQALGLPNDSWWYPDSTFYQGWSEHLGSGLADIDEAVIRLLYDPRIKAGMTIEDLERIGL